MIGSQYALNYTPCSLGTFINAETGECRPAGCGSWSCVDCGPRKVRRFLKRIAPPAWTYMVTLTLEGDGEATKDNIKAINAHWRVWQRWLQRNHKLEHFTWVNEQGSQTGRLHKHALVKCSRFGYRAARRAVTRAGFGRVCDFSPIRTARGARFYVSKYLAKSLPVKWPRYSRRCQTSCPQEKSSEKWILQKWLRFRNPTSPQRVWHEVAFQEAMNNELERDALTADIRGEQLALIPNTKNCVREDALQESWSFENTRAGP